MDSIKQLSFRCREKTWRRFKMYCTFNNVHVQDKIAELIEDCVSQKEEKVASEENTQHRGNIRSLPN